MKKLHFQYKMMLTMDRQVGEHHFLVRCRPMEGGGQRLLSFSCVIRPETQVSEAWDGFGNCGLTGVICSPHSLFEVKAEGVVEKQAEPDRRFHPMYRFPSAYTSPDESMLRFLSDTRKAFGGELKEPEGRVFLMRRLHDRLSYVPGVTNTKTTASQAFAGGQGVCQDYAHIFISLCRGAGVPARYAAGMMLGEGATHAWAEIWDGESWVGMDPTNDRLTDETYIKLTHGRDFADGAVEKGCFVGFALQSQQIYVKVEEVTEKCEKKPRPSFP